MILRDRLLLMGLLIALVACSDHDGVGKNPVIVPDPSIETYAGPPARADLEVMESEPLQYAISLKVEVPTGGFSLEHDTTKADAEGTWVYFSLTEPGAEENALQALQELDCREGLGAVARPIHVLVTRKTRGTPDVSTPPHGHLKTFPR